LQPSGEAPKYLNRINQTNIFHQNLFVIGYLKNINFWTKNI